jgi:hypothetical protein
MASKIKVIENPTEADIMRRLGGKYRPNFSRDDLFPIRKLFPMWKLLSTSVVDPDYDDPFVLGCNFTPGASEIQGNYVSWLILESEESEVKIMCISTKPPQQRWPHGYKYDCQVYGHVKPFEIEYPYKKSPVHQLAVYLAFGEGAHHSWGHRYAHRFKALDYLGKKFNAKEFLEFCQIRPADAGGGSYEYNGYDLYWTHAKGIELKKRDEDSHRFTWTVIASAFTDILGFDSAQPPAGEVKKVWKQVPLFGEYEKEATTNQRAKGIY